MGEDIVGAGVPSHPAWPLQPTKIDEIDTNYEQILKSIQAIQKSTAATLENRRKDYCFELEKKVKTITKKIQEEQ